MQGFDHFDFLAPLYETFIQPKDPQVLWRLADLPTEGVLLDAGGGTGRMAQFMVGQAERVVVADLSRKMLSEARRKDGLLTVCSHTERLPFGEGAFARIIMVDALHHVCNQQETIEELWRALRPGGRLVIEEPDVRSFAVKLIALAEKLALMRSHFLSPQQIKELLHFPDARVWIETEPYTAWVVAEKTRQGG